MDSLLRRYVGSHRESPPVPLILTLTGKSNAPVPYLDSPLQYGDPSHLPSLRASLINH